MLPTTRGKVVRMTTGERIARDRRRGRRLAQHFRYCSARGDEDRATARLQPHAAVMRLRQQGGEARPASRRLHRILGDYEYFGEAQRIHLRRTPEVRWRHVFHILDAP